MDALTIFLAGFLLFVIQPMAAKQLLPVFGGSAAVWTTCLLFFQTVLLVGYAWAHVARRTWHVAFAVVGVCVPLIISNTAKGGEHPIIEILTTLTFSVGMPCVLIASTSPLVQRWSKSEHPYRLYAVSNAACLIALLAYPILIEPALTLDTQRLVWEKGTWVLAALAALLATRSMSENLQPLTGGFRWRWFALAAVSSGLLMSTTNQMCQEVAAIPFLWVVPLAIYLIAFIICFDRPAWYRHAIYAPVCAALVTVSSTIAIVGLALPVWIHLLAYSATLFCCLMVCNGQLFQERPHASTLTSFYLAMAAGGAAGGVMVALVAPAVLTNYAEFPISLAACLLLAIPRGGLKMINRPAVLVMLLGAFVAITAAIPAARGNLVDARRNFYGILRVSDENGQRILTHGATKHGVQWLDRDRRREPTAYFSKISGAGMTISNLPANAHVGIIGLGAGTLAAYGRAGDRYRFYEINPDVLTVAQRDFSFLRDSEASITNVIGDARLRLAEEPSQQFDLLVIDAFSSDSIPLHLLTSECADIYRRHLKPNGKLLFHISNTTLNLDPVVSAIGERLGWRVTRVNSGGDAAQGIAAATWMVLDSNLAYEARPTLAWTDQFASLWPIFKRPF
jgi:hypothetical protein